jgi:hypothetical protein
MGPVYDPVRLTHPRLREFAFQAAFIATLAATAHDLEDLLIDLPPDEPLLPDFHPPWPWAFDPMAVALAVVKTHRTGVVHALEELLAAWLGEDREHGPVLPHMLLDPWQERPGIWSEDTPDPSPNPVPPRRSWPSFTRCSRPRLSPVPTSWPATPWVVCLRGTTPAPTPTRSSASSSSSSTPTPNGWSA